MAFVVESIDSPELQAELKSLRLKSPFSIHDPMDLRTWCVDRQAGLYFVIFGGGGREIPVVVAIADKDGALLEAEGHDKKTGQNVPKGVDVSWEIFSVRILPRGAGRREELISALREGLVAYGAYGDPNVTRSVHISLASTNKQ